MNRTQRTLSVSGLVAAALLGSAASALADPYPVQPASADAPTGGMGLPRGDRTTVSQLQPDPDRVVRVVGRTGNGNPKFDDGIVREVKLVNADEDLYAIKLYRPVYNDEVTIYRKGTDTVTVPTRTANEMLGAQGDHEREMEARKPGWGG